MKPAAFEYHAPTTVADTLSLLASLPDARILAGGQTLMPMMNFRFLAPEHLVDVAGVPELSGIALREGRLHIGAMTRQRDIELSPLVRRVAPLLPEAYALVSHKQIRNRGTLGGSLCQLDPGSEQPCFTAALDGVLKVAGLRDGAVRQRQLAMADWAQGYMTTALEEGELLQGVSLDIWPEGHGYCFEEYTRRHGDFAIVGVAALCTAGARGALDRLSLAICGLGPGPVRLHQVERELRGAAMDERTIRIAASHARRVEAMSDAHVGSDYRQHLAGVLTERALRTAFRRARTIL